MHLNKSGLNSST